jgi:hypothetical protein
MSVIKAQAAKNAAGGRLHGLQIVNVTWWQVQEALFDRNSGQAYWAQLAARAVCRAVFQAQAAFIDVQHRWRKIQNGSPAQVSFSQNRVLDSLSSPVSPTSIWPPKTRQPCIQQSNTSFYRHLTACRPALIHRGPDTSCFKRTQLRVRNRSQS